MKGIVASLAAWLVAGLLLSPSGFAQGVQTGSIRGVVKDQQDLPAQGVMITATSPALQGARTTTSDSQGGFTLRALPAGVYQVKFELAGFATTVEKTEVYVGLTVDQAVTLKAAGVSEAVDVVAETPAPIATSSQTANFKHDEIESLATGRSLLSISTLAPGLNTNTPNDGQVSINGAFAFDNIFMINGVDVNDNLFGSPNDLFIEDAIEQTQVLTSGIPAEYGRFTGGVINAITKSGGNRFSGSYRANFSNPRWSTQTPFETCDPSVVAAGCTVAPKRPNNLELVHEGTFGGPIVKDRLWFFLSGRHSDVSSAATLPVTNLPNTQTSLNKRGEVKITGTPIGNHTIQGGYLNDPSQYTNAPSLGGATIDPAGLTNPSYPNWYTYVNYHGVFGSKLLAEAQYSHRKLQFNNSGGSSTNIVDSPFISLTLDNGNDQFNAPYFDATDPESRNNSQVTGNVTYFLSTGKAGRHELKAGYEWFRSQDVGGNSQSASNYVFYGDYVVDPLGNPVLDASGRLMPDFSQFNTLILHWIPVRGATINVDNNSAFAQDHWAINNRLSADLGVRFEKVRTEATGGLLGIDTDTIVPRLGISYDLQGNGRNIIHATYGHYSGRYNEAQVSRNTNVGNPDLVYGVYIGPSGQGRNYAPGFDPNNYFTLGGVFPTANVSLASGLSSPIVKEFTFSYGTSWMNGKGYLEGAYIWRNTTNLIEDFITLANGVTDVVKDGVDAGTFTNIVYRNTNLAMRDYQSLQFQGRYSVMKRWSVNGNYTVQLKNEGNYEGEGPSQPGVTSVIGDYPEAFTASRNYPTGNLASFQRHKLLLWSIYDVDFGRFGDTSFSGLLRVNSGTTFSYASTGQPLTGIQSALISAYPDSPGTQTVFFGDRGTGEFKGYGIVDFDASYNVPVFRTLRPWVKFDVFNLFNNQKLIYWNTTVHPDPSSPTDALGLPTGYLPGSRFGKATSNGDFPVPFLGFSGTGGRTYRVSVGLRF